MSGLFVQYGAGNIGRGFIGPLFSRAGYDVAFIDVDDIVVGALNQRRGYTVEIVSNDGVAYDEVKNVYGVDGRDKSAVSEAIAGASCMATAVGVNIMPRIAPMLAEGLRLRWKKGNREAFNIIICENIVEADKYLARLICEALDDAEKELFSQTVGLIEASIGRMVPVVPPEDREKDPLLVRVERYCELPIDAAAIKGKMPEIEGMHPFSPFGFYIERKLYLHNMSHALTAYVGFLAGHETIWRASEDTAIALLAERAMLESAAALSKKFDVPLCGILDHVFDLQLRYKNRALGDTVARVGRDTLRKLKVNDRFAGAVQTCEDAGVAPVYICVGLAAALRFDIPGDENTAEMRKMLNEMGIDASLEAHSGIKRGSEAAGMIKRYLKEIDSGAGAYELLRAAEREAGERLGRKTVI